LRWSEVLGSHELLRRRLRTSTSATPEALLKNRCGSAHMPAWTRTLGTILFNTPSGDTVSTNKLPPIPFEDVFASFLFHARQQLRAKAGSSLSVLSPAAVSTLDRELLEHLSFVSSLTLGRVFYDFRFACSPLAAFESTWIKQQHSSEIYSAFIAHLRDGGLIDVFDRYPVLARLLAQSVDLWVRTTASLCRRFAADWPRLREFFGWTHASSRGAIIGLKSGLSDRHSGGQTVAELMIAGGKCIIYKPRSVRPEIAFNTLLAWLNQRDLPQQLQTMLVLDRSSYGWMEAARHCDCEDTSAVERFYVRAGMLLAVLHILAVTDIHCENLIASGEQPVVVDLETLLSELPGRRSNVLNTGFLPRRLKEPSVDVSALGADESPDSGLRFPLWKNINTDQMTLAEAAPSELEFHRARIENRLPSVGDYLPSLRHGFSATYHFILVDRGNLARHPLVRRFDGLKLRILLRDSTTYAQILLHLLYPEFLQDGIDRSIEIEWLARPLCLRSKASKGRVNVYKHERTAIERLDLPYFNTSLWSSMGHDPSSEEARLFGGRRDARLMRNRLRQLSITDCQKQLMLIERSVNARFGRAAGTGHRG